MIGTSQPVRRHPVAQPQVVLGVEEHLGDRVVGARLELGDQVADVALLVDRARVLLREGRDPDAEVAGRLHQGHQLLGVLKPLGVSRPVGLRVARRVATQGKDIAYAGRRVLPDDVPELGDRVVDGGEVADRQQRGVGRDLLGHAHRRVAGRAAGAVGHGDEAGRKRLELTDRLPELTLALLGLRREELEGERPVSVGEQVANRRCTRREGGSHDAHLIEARPFKWRR